jgi:hypothetical protein
MLHAERAPEFNTDPDENVKHRFEIILIDMHDHGGWVWF